MGFGRVELGFLRYKVPNPPYTTPFWVPFKLGLFRAHEGKLTQNQIRGAFGNPIRFRKFPASCQEVGDTAAKGRLSAATTMLSEARQRFGVLGYIRVILGLYRVYIGIMENKMQTTI